MTKKLMTLISSTMEIKITSPIKQMHYENSFLWSAKKSFIIRISLPFVWIQGFSHRVFWVTQRVMSMSFFLQNTNHLRLGYQKKWKRSIIWNMLSVPLVSSTDVLRLSISPSPSLPSVFVDDGSGFPSPRSEGAASSFGRSYFSLSSLGWWWFPSPAFQSPLISSSSLPEDGDAFLSLSVLSIGSPGVQLSNTLSDHPTPTFVVGGGCPCPMCFWWWLSLSHVFLVVTVPVPLSVVSVLVRLLSVVVASFVVVASCVSFVSGGVCPLSSSWMLRLSSSAVVVVLSLCCPLWLRTFWWSFLLCHSLLVMVLPCLSLLVVVIIVPSLLMVVSIARSLLEMIDSLVGVVLVFVFFCWWRWLSLSLFFVTNVLVSCFLALEGLSFSLFFFLPLQKQSMIDVVFPTAQISENEVTQKTKYHISKEKLNTTESFIFFWTKKRINHIKQY